MPSSLRDQVASLVGALARLGWTRIGSPGIFGVHTASAMGFTPYREGSDTIPHRFDVY